MCRTRYVHRQCLILGKTPGKKVLDHYDSNFLVDRYVVMGNHRDAWVFGAIDPSSGTAVMKEISRSMGKLVRGGQCFAQSEH